MGFHFKRYSNKISKHEKKAISLPINIIIVTIIVVIVLILGLMFFYSNYSNLVSGIGNTMGGLNRTTNSTIEIIRDLGTK